MLAAALVASMSLLLPHVVSTGSSVCCVPLGQGRFQEGSVGGLEFSGGDSQRSLVTTTDDPASDHAASSASCDSVLEPQGRRRLKTSRTGLLEAFVLWYAHSGMYLSTYFRFETLAY